MEKIMPDQLTIDPPNRGRCKECDKFVSVYSHLATILYVSITRSWSIKTNRQHTCAMSHILDCTGHEPTKASLSKHPELTWDAQMKAFYEEVTTPVYEWAIRMTEVISHYKQEKRFVKGKGTQLGKKKPVYKTAPKRVRVRVGSKTEWKRVATGDLPKKLQKSVFHFTEKP